LFAVLFLEIVGDPALDSGAMKCKVLLCMLVAESLQVHVHLAYKCPPMDSLILIDPSFIGIVAPIPAKLLLVGRNN